jgi:4'-phosphopantetheinyl transferase EntD
MPDLSRLSVALQGLLPAGAAVAATDPQADHPVFPGEEIAAVPHRQREFAAGRAALRDAMATLGLPATAIPKNPDRSPALPPGLAASITHTETACLAAAMVGAKGLGIDLEPDAPLPPDLIDTVLTPAEGAYRHDARLIFSAKEALYKAQYPVSATLFGFDAIAIALQPMAFTAKFLQAVPGFPAGTRLEGRWTRAEGHILTALVI